MSMKIDVAYVFPVLNVLWLNDNRLGSKSAYLLSFKIELTSGAVASPTYRRGPKLHVG